MRVHHAALAVLLGCSPQRHGPDGAYVQPAIHLDDDDLWRSAGPAQVQGQVQGLTELTLNGQAATVDGDQFSARVTLHRGVNLLEARGVDGRGDPVFTRQGMLAGDYATPDLPVTRALTMRVNRSGLLEATTRVADLIDPNALSAGLPALNPVYADSYGVFGWNAVTVEADLVDVQFGTPQISPDPRAGVLAVQVAIPNLQVQAYVDGTVVGIGFGSDVWVGASQAVVDAHVTVAAAGGRLQVQVLSPTVALHDFWYDTSLLPGDVESWVLVDTLRTKLEDTLRTQLQEMLPPLIDSALADLDISYQKVLLNKQVRVAATFAAASVDPSGIQVTGDVGVHIPPSLDRPWVGYLSAAGQAAQPSLTADLGVTVSDNLLNNVLFQAWRAGLLRVDLDSAQGQLNPALLAQLGATDAARVVVDARLPPVVIQQDDQLMVQVTELVVRVETPQGTHGDWLEAAVTAQIPVTLEVQAGVLKIRLGSPDFTLDVRDGDWPADRNAITNLLSDQLPITSLIALFGAFELPLPSVGGITIGSALVGRDLSGVHSTLVVNL